MISVLTTPGKYLQGRGALQYLPGHMKYMGENAAVISDGFVLGMMEAKLTDIFAAWGMELQLLEFQGESTRKEAERLAELVRQSGCGAVIGMGGGKAIDTAKLTAHLCGLPMIIVPTVASSDAPCSANTVIYSEEGVFEEAVRLPSNPDIVLVDTDIIATAPVRTLIAGIGDAFATYYEARACKQSGALNFNGGRATEAGYGMARLCRDLLWKYAPEAKQAVEEKRWCEALEKVVEANIYLSGVGFENNGCAVAHAVYNGLTAVIVPFHAMHGEAVAYGTYAQLLLEGTEPEEMKRITEFYRATGMPRTLAQLGVIETTEDLLQRIAESVCLHGKHTKNMPFPVLPEKLIAVLKRMESEA